MSIYEFIVKNNKGEDVLLENYKDKVLLIVNTASKCGFTPQYKGLEELYQKYKDKNFIILAFPCNQFAGQEPLEDKEIQNFCEINYGVTFPVMSKVKVNGKDTIPLYKYLKSEAKGLLGSEAIKWNFTKFLINKKGEVVTRYASSTKPEDLAEDIEKELNNIISE